MDQVVDIKAVEVFVYRSQDGILNGYFVSCENVLYFLVPNFTSFLKDIFFI